MIDQAVNELRDQIAGKFDSLPELESVTSTLRAAAYDLQNGIESEPSSIFYHEVETALNTIVDKICPPPCKLSMIDPAWWDSPAGQLIAAVQYWLYKNELIMPAEAARRIYGDSLEKSLVGVDRYAKTGAIRRVRRTEGTYTLRRKAHKGEAEKKTRGWLLFASDVDALVERRKADEIMKSANKSIVKLRSLSSRK